MAVTKVSASRSKVPASTKTTPSVALSAIATAGVWNLRSTIATGLNRTPSAAIVKRIRDPVITEPFSVQQVEIMTAIDTNATPTAPTRLPDTYAATRFDRLIC